MGIQVGTGIASGIDTNAIIEQLMKSEKKPIEKMLGHKKFLEAKISSYGNILNTMAALKKSTTALTAASLLTAVSSNENIVKATAENGAEDGSHTMKVNSIATSHSLYSGIFTSANASVADGDKPQKLMIQVGQGDKLQLTVDKTNNTLSGLSKAINDAKVGVKTMVVNIGDVFTINGSNGEIDFSDGQENKTANLKEGSYTGEDLAKEIARALNEANGTDKFEASYDATERRFKIYNYDDKKDITFNMDEESPMAKMLGLKTDEEIVLKKGGGGVMSDFSVKGLEGFRLVVAADAQGALNTITIKVDEKGDGKYEDGGKEGGDADNAGLSRLAFDPNAGINNMAVATEAKDAEFEFDGYKITRDSNKIKNLAAGLTIDLIAESEGKTVTINVKQDVKKMEESIAPFAER
ncbi:MAG: flagellar filament capping protein FliD [Nitrospirae bacterium]|nr:flagellar filament capping protein FliD [Nitrospirota bacterium]